jgi:hypothetical protein
MEQSPLMSQRIFDLGLSLETVSLYLLCCGLADAGEAISTRLLQDRWNGSDADLQTSLEELASRNILQQRLSDGQHQTIYQVVKDAHWRVPRI